MKKYYVPFGMDEFNSLLFNNILLKDNKKNYPDSIFYTNTNETFDVLFNEFDFIINNSIPHTIEYFKVDTSVRPDSLYKPQLEIQYKVDEYYTKNNIERLGLRPPNEIHHYHYIFPSISKFIQEKTFKWITPKRKDYEEIKNQFDKINKPIVAISGRNLIKIPTSNEYFVNCIEYLIKKNCYVVNVTISPPGLLYPKENYMEVNDTVFTYSKMASIFLNSNFVIAPMLAGGITTHLCTQANFCLYQHINWNHAHNKNFAYNGKTIVDARQEAGMRTTIFNKDLNVLNSCIQFEKPKDIKFFDENKLIYL